MLETAERLDVETMIGGVEGPALILERTAQDTFRIIAGRGADRVDAPILLSTLARGAQQRAILSAARDCLQSGRTRVLNAPGEGAAASEMLVTIVKVSGPGQPDRVLVSAAPPPASEAALLSNLDAEDARFFGSQAAHRILHIEEGLKHLSQPDFDGDVAVLADTLARHCALAVSLLRDADRSLARLAA
ncbi:MAG: hypothetical protein AAF618_06535 [Pseudomonadota bacterium]